MTGDLTILKAHRRRIQLSTTSAAQYEQAVSAFEQNPAPAGMMLNWVCRENADYLSVSRDWVQLTPVS
jgi:hypothetical protein